LKTPLSAVWEEGRPEADEEKTSRAERAPEPKAEEAEAEQNLELPVCSRVMSRLGSCCSDRATVRRRQIRLSLRKSKWKLVEDCCLSSGY
jgi:hypothetical protein